MPRLTILSRLPDGYVLCSHGACPLRYVQDILRTAVLLVASSLHVPTSCIPLPPWISPVSSDIRTKCWGERNAHICTSIRRDAEYRTPALCLYSYPSRLPITISYSGELYAHTGWRTEPNLITQSVMSSLEVLSNAETRLQEQLPTYRPFIDMDRYQSSPLDLHKDAPPPDTGSSWMLAAADRVIGNNSFYTQVSTVPRLSMVAPAGAF